MRRLSRTFLVGAAIAILGGCGSSDNPETTPAPDATSQPEAAAAPSPPAPTKPTEGALGPGTYRNDFFGFSLSFPESWEVLSSAQRRMTQETGAQIVAGDDRRLREAMNVANEHTHALLMIMEQPLGSNTTQFNPSLQIGAVNMAALGDESNVASFLQQTANVLQNSRLKAQVVNRPQPVEIGGKTFYESMLQTDAVGTTAKLRYYATRQGDYMLYLVATYAKFIEGQELQTMVHSLTFDE